MKEAEELAIYEQSVDEFVTESKEGTPLQMSQPITLLIAFKKGWRVHQVIVLKEEVCIVFGNFS